MPKLNAPPYFAHWTTPLDPAGRWLCLDRRKKSGLYDRVYFDSTGNGRLDDKTPVGTSRSDQYSAYFEPVRVVFKGEDGPITYHLVLRFMQYDGGEANLLASSGGYYAGKVDIGGKKRQIELIDENVNGTFNDRGAEMGDSDCVTVEGDKVGERYLGKLLEVDGQFYQIEVARDGAFIKLQKAENVVLGQVRVPETISEFVAFGENGHFVRKPAKGEFTLPAGKYRIQDWKIDRKDDKGAAWELIGLQFQRFRPVRGRRRQTGVAGGGRADAGRDGGPGAEQSARCEGHHQTGRFQSPVSGPLRRDAADHERQPAAARAAADADQPRWDLPVHQHLRVWVRQRLFALMARAQNGQTSHHCHRRFCQPVPGADPPIDAQGQRPEAAGARPEGARRSGASEPARR